MTTNQTIRKHTNFNSNDYAYLAAKVDRRRDHRALEHRSQKRQRPLLLDRARAQQTGRSDRSQVNSQTQQGETP
ncbi:MAG: hypothetical protein AW11_02574 [Candidatus Accumulibacter regalis]|jgi:hypothetical protein|uniref:Uncharacterized protein n=1 Tax=Accumulibacter regalis TaxID=522306 RepID=A0A011QEE1_ACCRE|nr:MULTISPECIES: hypothetical protein [unclassified Candidatus Accumulibacter]EXI87445.1 MAG: hypothetical protein AW11_02574 [Candidatus Accumulibacter regalis]HRE70845.1 hypothetical protein [Accumulibacter sp.]